MHAPRVRLLAIDLDGTLLRADDVVDPRDRAALARARAAGIEVIIATGRMPAATLPLARDLGLAGPLICADGAVVLRATDGAVEQLHPMEAAAVAGFFDLAHAYDLRPLLLTVHAVLGHPCDADAVARLGGWAAPFVPLSEPTSVASVPAGVLAALALGPALRVTAARTAVQSIGHSADAFTGAVLDDFPLGATGTWALRGRRSGIDKGQALAAVARSRGLTAGAVAAVGDWYNDMPMLSWAAHSYVMAGAPGPVLTAARRQLRAVAGTGAGVAEVVADIIPEPLLDATNDIVPGGDPVR